MPLANKSNVHLDGTSKSRGYMSGKDVTWTGEDTNKHIENWMKDMGMIVADTDIPKAGTISECLIASGMVGTDMILAKNRDRMFTPIVSIVRCLSKSGIELVLMYDHRTQFVEGMNEYGVGILNATLLNEDDAVERPGYNSRQGKLIYGALCCKSLDEAIGYLSSRNENGLEGHSLIADPLRAFHVELSEGEDVHITKLDPQDGFDVRTNHGVIYTGGYSPKDKDHYISSKLRSATAEVELMDATDDIGVLNILQKQNFPHDSNYNVNRMVPGKTGMFTSSQTCMNLSTLTFSFHSWGSHCDFKGLEDKTPSDHEAKITVNISRTEQK